ncbi:MAG: DUF1439 domain-containing protein [Sulfurimonadaceae bacterium]
MRLVILFLLTFTSLFALKFDYVIPELVLQERMKKEFPIVHKTMLLTFHVSNPKLYLDGKKQRFNFTGQLQIPNIQDEKGNAVSAVVSVSSRIAYTKGGNLYLRKIKVVDIKSKFIGTDMKSMLYGTMDQLLNEYFKTRPIYSLEKEKGMVGAAVESIQNVVIVKDGVKIIFNLG